MSTMTQSWTDGHSSVQQDGPAVTVRILGDVWRSRYADDGEAAVMFDAEVAALCSTMVVASADDDGLTWEQWRFGR